jgi:hypothetical protein
MPSVSTVGNSTAAISTLHPDVVASQCIKVFIAISVPAIATFVPVEIKYILWAMVIFLCYTYRRF